MNNREYRLTQIRHLENLRGERNIIQASLIRKFKIFCWVVRNIVLQNSTTSSITYPVYELVLPDPQFGCSKLKDIPRMVLHSVPQAMFPSYC